MLQTVSVMGQVLTKVNFLHLVSNLLCTLDMRNDYTGSASIQRRRQADGIMLGYPYNNHGLALGMVLSGVDGTEDADEIGCELTISTLHFD